MTLFQLGNFTLSSGVKSPWKIECDALVSQDWMALARMAVDVLKPFSHVLGVPTGGEPFAAALETYCVAGADRLLIAEDVCTTGGSITKFREGLGKSVPKRVQGVCVFARERYPHWVTPLFRMPGTYTTPDDGE